MTFISRITGLIRDVVMANILGSSALADAFFMAFRIPNFLRRIFGEGAFSQAFVPVFSELTVDNTEQAKRFVNATAGMLALVTLGLSILGVIFAPAVVTVFAPGFLQHPDKFAATVDMLRIMFPYLFCISLVAMSGGILNSVNRFAIPAVTPVLLNVCMIAALWGLTPLLADAGQALAWGVMGAGLVQLAFQVPSLRQAGYLPSFTIDRQNPAMRKVFTLMLPAMISVSVAQINTLVNMLLASFLVTGSVSWLYYSDRLMEFPVGVFGIALATVVLPNLSRVHTQGSSSGFSDMLDWALRWVVVISLPATVALIILAVPLLSTIFQYNAFSANDVLQSASALKAFSFGICGFIFVKVLAPGFFARQNTKTPMKVAVVAMLVNVIASLILVQYLQHVGLALAISIAAWVNALLLYILLIKEQAYTPASGWLWFMLRVTVAVLVMALVLVKFNHTESYWIDGTLLTRVRSLTSIVVIGALTYFAALLALGIRPHQMLLKPQ